MNNLERCEKCEGCGKVTDGDNEDPWIWWTDLPFRNAAAVAMGVVMPKDCPVCQGTGKVEL